MNALQDCPFVGDRTKSPLGKHLHRGVCEACSIPAPGDPSRPKRGFCRRYPSTFVDRRAEFHRRDVLHFGFRAPCDAMESLAGDQQNAEIGWFVQRLHPSNLATARPPLGLLPLFHRCFPRSFQPGHRLRDRGIHRRPPLPDHSLGEGSGKGHDGNESQRAPSRMLKMVTTSNIAFDKRNVSHYEVYQKSQNALLQAMFRAQVPNLSAICWA